MQAGDARAAAATYATFVAALAQAGQHHYARSALAAMRAVRPEAPLDVAACRALTEALGPPQPAARTAGRPAVQPAEHLRNRRKVYNRLIQSFIAARQPGWADSLFWLMQVSLIPADEATFALLVAGWAEADDPDRAWAIFQAMASSFVPGSVATYRQLVALFDRHFQPDRTLEVFRAVKNQRIAADPALYADGISALSRAQEAEPVWTVLEAMQEANVVGTIEVYNAVIGVLAHCRQPERAWAALQAAAAAGVEGDEQSYFLLAQAFHRCRRWRRGISLMETVDLPDAAKPHLAELYRQAGGHARAIGLCDEVLAQQSSAADIQSAAWTMKLVALAEFDRARFLALHRKAPLQPSSPLAIRVQCARIFARVPPDHADDPAAVKKTLRDRLPSCANLFARDDITQALAILSA